MQNSIGNYNIIREISSGGMATVYLALDTQNNERVAIKILHERLLSKEKIYERFQQEGLFKLDHPNIVKILDAGIHKNSPYIVMEYIEGQDLEEYIKQKGRLDLDTSQKIFTQLLNALSYVHSKGIIHRDIKPKNILIDKNGTAKLTDFGIAKSLYSHIKTSTGGYLGAPAYSSPEQMDGEAIDQRSDIYSLGITFYEMLAGTTPFGSTSIEKILKAKFIGKPIPITNFRNDIPANVIVIIERCIAKNPSERFSSVNQIIATLKKYLNDTVITKPTDMSYKKPLNKPVLIFSILVPVLIAIIIITAIRLGFRTTIPETTAGDKTYYSILLDSPSNDQVFKLANENESIPISVSSKNIKNLGYKLKIVLNDVDAIKTFVSPPYEYNWTPDGAGGYKIVANLIDSNDTIISSSNVVNFTVEYTEETIETVKRSLDVETKKTKALNNSENRSQNGAPVFSFKCYIPPVIDGKIDEWAIFDKAQIVNPTIKKENFISLKDCSGMLYTCWDDSNFYFAVQVTDDVFSQMYSGNRINNGDSVTLVFDTDLSGDFNIPFYNSDDSQIDFSSGNFSDIKPSAFIYFPSNKEENILIKSSQQKDGYIIEASVPWENFVSYGPKDLDVLGFTATIFDTDNLETTELAMSSSPGFDINNANTLGTLVFIDGGDLTATYKPLDTSELIETTAAEKTSTEPPEATTSETKSEAIVETSNTEVKYNIGNPGPAGGYIFYINPNYEQDGWRYLEAAPKDQSSGIQWYNGVFIDTGATATAIGTGKSNTQKIVDIQSNGNYAAKLCIDLTVNGYKDWFLPSIDELGLIYENLYLKGLGGFNGGNYWSSSEWDVDGASLRNFYVDYPSGIVKYYLLQVRAVRAF